MSEPKRLGRITITKDALGSLLNDGWINGVPADSFTVEFLIHNAKDDTLNVYIASEYCALINEGDEIPQHDCIMGRD